MSAVAIAAHVTIFDDSSLELQQDGAAATELPARHHATKSCLLNAGDALREEDAAAAAGQGATSFVVIQGDDEFEEATVLQMGAGDSLEDLIISQLACRNKTKRMKYNERVMLLGSLCVKDGVLPVSREKKSLGQQLVDLGIKVAVVEGEASFGSAEELAAEVNKGKDLAQELIEQRARREASWRKPAAELILALGLDGVEATDLQQLRATFDYYDADGNGVISRRRDCHSAAPPLYL